MSAPADREARLRIVHDLNNVLTILSGELQLLESADERVDTAAMREALARGVELVRELARLG